MDSRAADSYAAVLGEALWDLLDRPTDGHYVSAAGGSCLNVAVGLARLGDRVEFAAALGDDVLGDRLRRFLTGEGVQTSACRTVPAQSTLAVTTFDGAEPSFAFYGHPGAYTRLVADERVRSVAAGAAVVHAGSIPLLSADVRAAVLTAFQATRGWKTLDFNVRADLIEDLDGYRRGLEDLAASADLVKLSVVDAAALSAEEPPHTARRLIAGGATAVVITAGAGGARLMTADLDLSLPSRADTVLDTTGAGDATMVGIIHTLLTHGWPAGEEDWTDMLSLAMTLAGLVCARPGGATAMPTRVELDTRASGTPDLARDRHR